MILYFPGKVPPSADTQHKKFDAVAYFRQISHQSKQIQAEYKNADLGVQGVAAAASYQDDSLRIVKVCL